MIIIISTNPEPDQDLPEWDPENLEIDGIVAIPEDDEEVTQ